MNNDSISREWLEDAFDNLCCHNCKICRNFRIEDSFYKCALIDNAQTVESDKDLYEKIETYKNAYRIMSDAFENEVRKNKRPQGEWIIDGHHYKCSRCGKTLAIMFSETDDGDLIGCPFCLADMRVNGGRE